MGEAKIYKVYESLVADIQAGKSEYHLTLYQPVGSTITVGEPKKMPTSLEDVICVGMDNGTPIIAVKEKVPK